MATLSTDNIQSVPVLAGAISPQAEDASSIQALNLEDLQKKYEQERDTRLRNGGLEQYRNAWKSGLDDFVKDPFSKQVQRDPVDAAHEVVIVGGGFGGLLIAARLLEAGISDFVILEQGGDFGGTWYWNRYPGAQCDIDSYIYMPLLEELGYIPTEKYCHGPELLDHSRNIGHKYGLYEKALFHTQARSFTWDEGAGIWHVETDRQDKIRGHWIIPTAGPQNTPKFPGLSGIERFQGKSFHTCRWDYDFTKGDHNGNLTGLSNKRVAIIGTGATSVQVVPRVAESAKHLYVYQRTPSAIDARNNRPTDQEWVKTLTPGWQQRRMDNFSLIVGGHDAEEDLVNDGWTNIFRTVAAGIGPGDNGRDLTPEQLEEKRQLADFKRMEYIRARVDAIVQDPKTAAPLKPWYNQFCKRPCFHDEYLQAFNRPNVTLVDTHGRGVEAITEDGIVANGEEIKVDCIIYATGFEWQTEWSQRTGTQIYGRQGLTITEKWADGISTFHGWGVNGFPNCLILAPSQSGFTPNYTHNVDFMSRHFAHIINYCKSHGIDLIEPSLEAERGWVEEIIRVGKGRQKFLEACTPGYYNDEGRVSDKVTRENAYGGSGAKYHSILTEWRVADNLDGILKTQRVITSS